MTNPLQDLADDLAWAAGPGADKIGHAAVMAGAHHANSSAAELLNVEHIATQQAGQLHATVIAEQPVTVTNQGPQLTSSDALADVMAQTATDMGTKAAVGQR